MTETYGSEPILLLVDDDPDDVFFVHEALSRLCPAVRLFDLPDGQEAIDYLSAAGRYADRARFPLPTHVLMDLKLPRRTGIEVLAWIRAQGGLKRLPVTIISGSGLIQDVARVEALKGDYLVKPVGLSELDGLLRGFCEKAGFHLES